MLFKKFIIACLLLSNSWGTASLTAFGIIADKASSTASLPWTPSSTAYKFNLNKYKND